jgi:uncharacterized protein YlxP (DUF503 family)
MYVLALSVELLVPAAHSLKEKRMVVLSIVQAARQRYRVAAAEVGFQDKWQRTALGFAAVAESARHASDVIDEVERFVWSRPDVEVAATERRWLE